MKSSLSRSVAIAGVAESDLGKVPGKSALELQAQAARLALEDAGLRLRDVDAVFAHTDDRFASLQLSEFLNIRPAFVDSTNVGGMSNLLHVQRAMAAIHAGMCEVALITYGSTQLSDGSRKVTHIAECVGFDPHTQTYQLANIFERKTLSRRADGTLETVLEASGHMPRCTEELHSLELSLSDEVYEAARRRAMEHEG